MFSKILIANRGEIVVRIARTARRLGYATVAIHSEADRDAPYLRSCDEALAIGGNSSAESYLDIGKIIAACKRSGADALHPGYGFLAESAELARACSAAQICFIGPPAEAIAAMGDKAEARRRMLAAGVACIPGYQAAAGEDAGDAQLLAAAPTLGVPLMVKAAAGGGGRGIRRIDDLAALPAALATARSEAGKAFGAAGLILERAIEAARHVEVQVFADSHGHVVDLYERDCSLQRRHQKVIEEAPSPAVSAGLRQAMGRAACAAAAAVGYVGAGTVEFLLDASGNFFFMEMNTRLQVEHPVSECITGLDLVEWQLRVARGESLPWTARPPLRGHAIEARLYAEDPARGFLPQSGRLLRFRPAAGVRSDHALADGLAIGVHYDPLLAKIIAHGEDREEARRRLVAALRSTVVLGIDNNKDFLVACLEHPAFRGGQASTDFIGEHLAALCGSPGDDAHIGFAAAALLWLARAGRRLAQPALAGWHSGGVARYSFSLGSEETTRRLSVETRGDGHLRISAGEHSADAVLLDDNGETLRCLIDAQALSLPYAWQDEDRLHLEVRGRNLMVEDRSRQPVPRQASHSAAGVSIRPPMNGRIIAIHVAEGQQVIAGQALLVMEAMKMEHSVLAPQAGVVADLRARLGAQVAPTDLLLRLHAEEKTHAGPA